MSYLTRLASRAAGRPAPVQRGPVFPVEFGDASRPVESIPDTTGFGESRAAMTEPVGAPPEPDEMVRPTAVEDSLSSSIRPTSEPSVEPGVEPAVEPGIAIETAGESPTEEPVPAIEAGPGDAMPEQAAGIEVESKPRQSDPVTAEIFATPGTPARHVILDTEEESDLHEGRTVVAMPAPLSDHPEVSTPSPKAIPDLFAAAPPTRGTEPAPIDLHIGTIEIAAEPGPPMTTRGRQEPAGFSDYELLRNYEWDV